MEVKKSFLRLKDGRVQECNVKIVEKCIDGVHALWIDGTADQEIDAEYGAGIEFMPHDLKRWMADYRHSEYWCRPAFGIDLSDIPDETQGFIYEKNDGRFCVVLPVVSEEYKCVLAGTEAGSILAKLFSWDDRLTACRGLAVVWAEGESPYVLLEKCVRTALDLLGTGYRTRKERRYPELFEYLGWCSWDAFEIRVDENSLIEKCREFREKKIPVRWAIIDDMWAEIRDFYGVQYKDRPEMFDLMHSSRMYSFKADPYRFPNGLKSCIEKINDMGITVGMWHPTTGYWKGFDPDGEAFAQLKDCLIETPDGVFVPSPEQDKAYRYYCTIHDYLRKCGTEFIKIDNQSMSRRFYKNAGPVGSVARQFHDAMEASVGQHFDNQMINCMGMASEDMWNRSVSPISRCSDDFLPEDKAWFAKHILQCSYNSLIQGQFYYCDWDMWWSDDGQAVKNSVLRAISGGPVYVSDTLGRSRAEILKPLILEDGRILRCKRPAMPTRECITVNPLSSQSIFKLQNICENGGVIAAFNLDELDRPVSGTISPADIEELEGEEFGVYEHFSGEFCIMKKKEKKSITLQSSDDFRLYVIVPLENGSGMIGRTDKYISPATFRRKRNGSAELLEDGPYAYVEDRTLWVKN